MKYKLEVRSLPVVHQSVEDKHRAFSQALMASLPSPWRQASVPKIQDIGGDLSVLPANHAPAAGVVFTEQAAVELRFFGDQFVAEH